MLTVLDVGNTAVTYGTFKKSRLQDHGSCLYNDIPKIINNCASSGRKSTSHILLGSVVPQITHKVKKLAKRHKRLKLWVLGENLTFQLKHKYKQDKQLGMDRKVNMAGALLLYKAPFLVIDFGTAITFDFVSKKGVFEGGMIIPGPEISFQTLIKRAALLPKKARLPKNSASFLGKTTYDCMTSGILQGYGAMTDGLIERFKKRFGPLTVIATGGFASALKPFTRNIQKLDPLHSIQSLGLIARKAGLA